MSAYYEIILCHFIKDKQIPNLIKISKTWETSHQTRKNPLNQSTTKLLTRLSCNFLTNYNLVSTVTASEIVVKKIYFTAQLQKDRKLGLVAQKEKELLALIAVQKTQRNRESEFAKVIILKISWEF